MSPCVDLLFGCLILVLGGDFPADMGKSLERGLEEENENQREAFMKKRKDADNESVYSDVEEEEEGDRSSFLLLLRPQNKMYTVLYHF